MILIDEIKAIRSTKIELKKFGLLLGVVFGLLGAYYYWHGNSVFYYYIITGLLITGIGILIPKLLLPLQKGWMSVAVILGFFTSRIILCVLYYLIMFPIGLFLRLSGVDLLKTKIDKDSGSYWIKREKKQYDKSLAENQY